MATIPIEVIVQDVESPANPTPTPETNSTEESIAVPDTGAGTIGNSTFSSASVAGIILPAVLLVLSLATVCTLLIHRHHKRQDSKASKKKKLAAATSVTIVVLAATVLIGNLVLPATKAAISDPEVDIQVPDKISIVVNREDDITEATTEATAHITSTSAFGYKVLLSMAEGIDTANLYLDGDTTSEHYISATESTELGDNTWGFALTEDDEYNAIPLLDDAIVVAQGNEPVEDGTLSIYYGVMVSSDLPAGTYSGGEVEYNLVSLEPTISTLTYMQDFATLSESGRVSVLRSMTEDQQYYLKDNRDNKTYRIAKLKDGNVWMTQNLDLQKEDLLAGVTLDNTNTDNPVVDFELPNSQTDGNESWGDSDDEAAVNSLHIYDVAGSGKTYYYCTDPQPWGCQARGTDPIPVSEFGNYYNWHTATAGTGTYSLTSNEIASGSLCPSGWRLPNGGNYGVAIDLSNLLYEYGILQSRTSNDYDSSKLDDIYGSPLYLGRAGSYINGVIRAGEEGYIWYSMAKDTLTAQEIQYGSKQLFPWGHPYSSENKTVGHSVRCLAN